MTLRSRLAAIERAARRRRRRYPAARSAVRGPSFDPSDPAYIDVNRRVAMLLGSRTDLHPIDEARLIMEEDPVLAGDLAALIEKGFDVAAVVNTGTSTPEHE